jgi:uncharacterized protein
MLPRPLLGSELVKTKEYLGRIATALEAIAGAMTPAAEGADAMRLEEADAFHWQGESSTLLAVPRVSRVPLDMLRGIDHVRDVLLKNTMFCSRIPSSSRAVMAPTMRCFGAHAAWARVRS